MSSTTLIPTPAQLADLLPYLRRYLDAARRRNDWHARRIVLDHNPALPLRDAENDLIALFKSSGATSPFGWPDPVRDALIYIYQYV
jgi:hypothetical protein